MIVSMTHYYFSHCKSLEIHQRKIFIGSLKSFCLILKTKIENYLISFFITFFLNKKNTKTNKISIYIYKILRA